MSKYPERLILETTTRCNYQCRMCVKQTQGCRIPEGDMAAPLFERLKPLFPKAESVIFTGIGEPLLHPDLEKYISCAGKAMPPTGRTGFQTNGKLLSFDRARSLISAGTDVICISVDSTEPGLFKDVRSGGELSDVLQGIESVNRAREIVGPGRPGRVDLGIEVVLMKKNLAELPDVIRWAARLKIDFVMVSHLMAYDPAFEAEAAYMENSPEARDFFDDFCLAGLKPGMNMAAYDAMLFKYNKNKTEQEWVSLVQEMKAKASARDLFIDISKLLKEDKDYKNRLEEIIAASVATAEDNGIQLILPEMRPKNERSCRFVENNSLFVTWDGNLSPCYFLWHQYDCTRSGLTKHVTPLYFGNAMDQDPLVVWNLDAFKAYRKKVLLYDYPFCGNCCFTPCSYILDEPFENDCYGIDIPCCDCQWCSGLFNCLA